MYFEGGIIPNMRVLYISCKTNQTKMRCNSYIIIMSFLVTFVSGYGLSLDNTSKGLYHATLVFGQYKMWYLEYIFQVNTME